MSLGVVYNGDILFTGGSGTVKKGTVQTPTADTRFSVGSVTKIFTTLGLVKLIQNGVVALNEPVTNFYNIQNPPLFAPTNPFGSKTLAKVNLHSLATHTSGLTREPAGGVYAGVNEETIISFINALPLAREPLTHPHYSNLGMALLGRCLERAVCTRQHQYTNYEDWTVKTLLTPLTMSRSGFNYTDAVKAEMATGYSLDAATMQQIEYPLWAVPLGWSAACGGMYSTTNDMLRFIDGVFGANAGKGPVTLDSAREYALPGVMLPDAVSAYGLAGWEMAYANGFWTLTKGGLVGGFATSVAVIPELKFGVVAWINMMAGGIPDRVTSLTMSMFVPVLLGENAAFQAAKAVPSNYANLIGKYETVFQLALGPDTLKTGIFVGAMLSYPVTAWWEKGYDIPQQNTTAFRYRMVLKDGLDSCFALTGIGDNAIVYIIETPKAVYLSLPDHGIYSVVKS